MRVHSSKHVIGNLVEVLDSLDIESDDANLIFERPQIADHTYICTLSVESHQKENGIILQLDPK